MGTERNNIGTCRSFERKLLNRIKSKKHRSTCEVNKWEQSVIRNFDKRSLFTVFLLRVSPLLMSCVSRESLTKVVD